MSVFLSFVLSLPLFNSTSYRLTYDDMLDSAQIIVIGKVDSIWFSGEVMPWTNISATILGLYTRNDSLPLPKGSIHIVEPGGTRPDGISMLISDLPQFQVGETFLAAVEQDTIWHNSATEPIYMVFYNDQGKYRISRDSVFLVWENPMPLCTAVCSLSSKFIQRDAQ